MPDKQFTVVLHPACRDELQELAWQAGGDPSTPAGQILAVTLNHLQRLSTGAPSTHQLDFMPSYPDLSDCQTTYIGIDPDHKPAYRLVWREIPAREAHRKPVRQVLALGQREAGHAYHIAGQRLGRPHGVSLADLRAAPEPIRRGPAPGTPQPGRGPTAPSRVDPKTYQPSIPIDHTSDQTNQHSY